MLALLVAVPAAAEDQAVQQALEAAEPEVVEALPCRPTVACTAELVPAGFFEVEAGYGARLAAGGATHAGQLLLKYSLLDTLQLQVATNNLFLAGAGLTPRAVDGVMPGLKWLVNGQGTLAPANALSVHLALPTQGFDAAAQRTLDLQAWWYLTKDLGPVHADLNLALVVSDLGRRPTPQGLSALAVSAELGRGWGVFTEAWSSFGNGQAVALDGGSLNGVSFSPVDEVVLDAGFDVGFYPQTRSLSVFAGITFVPHRKSRAPLVVRPASGGAAFARAQ